MEGTLRNAMSASAQLVSIPIAWLGRHSYELYLFHVVVLALMRNVADTEGLAPAYKPLWFLVFIVLLYATASVISRFYSEPLNGWIRKRLLRNGPSLA
jgi:peptidoglycan/LPS O-acetylase OafA/YrhL